MPFIFNAFDTCRPACLYIQTIATIFIWVSVWSNRFGQHSDSHWLFRWIPKKKVCVRFPLTPHPVFPSWIHLPLLGPTVTQLHISLCPFASPLSSVCCNPRYYTLPVQIRSVGPLKSLCMEWNPPWVFSWRAWFVVLSEQSFRGFGSQSDAETLYKNAGLLQLKQ